jgi:PadR family transcriptional regulator PadR
MKHDKINAQMRKGVLELCILSVINNKEAYTSNILEALKNAELLVVEGTVYPLLTRLKNEGLLSYRWEESTSGPPRKYYSLTETGIEVIESLKSNWNKLSNSVNSLINLKSTSNE